MPDFLGILKDLVRQLTEVGMILVALAIVVQAVVGANQFFPDVVVNLVNLINSLGGHGVVGLIAIGIVIWLFSERKIS
jgi:hypothetical protein